jgi:aminobenzoyl-glutamate utilization protein B
MSFLAAAAVIALCSGLALSAQRGQAPAAATPPSSPKTEQYKKDLAAEVDSMKDFTQQMVDQVFSFGELGFQEVETSVDLTGILKKNGFTVEEKIAGISTTWMATWGSGKPVIALGSDVDCIPQASSTKRTSIS